MGKQGKQSGRYSLQCTRPQYNALLTAMQCSVSIHRTHIMNTSPYTVFCMSVSTQQSCIYTHTYLPHIYQPTTYIHLPGQLLSQPYR